MKVEVGDEIREYFRLAYDSLASRLSAAARLARIPRSPEALVGARHESVHRDRGPGRPARKALPNNPLPTMYERTTVEERKTALPVDSAERKRTPLCSGVLDYFTAALAEVAKNSVAGNDKHNPGKPLHWQRGKSNDHADCIMRHLAERGGYDDQGIRHSAALAWRALALLQEELEAEGAPLSRGSQVGE